MVDETYELFLDLDATEEQIDFPIVYASPAKAGPPSPAPRRQHARRDTLDPLFDTILDTIPAPAYTPGAPLQAQVTNLDASPFLGRLALCRVHQGEIRKGQQVAWIRTDGTHRARKITELLMTEALDRKPAEKAGPAT